MFLSFQEHPLRNCRINFSVKFTGFIRRISPQSRTSGDIGAIHSPCGAPENTGSPEGEGAGASAGTSLSDFPLRSINRGTTIYDIYLYSPIIYFDIPTIFAVVFRLAPPLRRLKAVRYRADRRNHESRLAYGYPHLNRIRFVFRPGYRHTPPYPPADAPAIRPAPRPLF